MNKENILERALNMHIDAVICISLESDEQRRIKTLKECDRIGLPVRFHIVKKNPNGGVVGCMESHIQIINYAKQNKFKNILVMEDDVQFDTEVLQNTNIQVPEDWEMFYLGYHVNKGYQHSQHILKILSGLTTHAYIMRDTLYDYVLDNITQDWKSIPEFYDLNAHEKPFFDLDNHAIDIFYAKWIHHRRNKTYGAYPLIAYQRPSFSHIENKNVDYTSLFKVKAQYYHDRYMGSFKGVFHIGSGPDQYTNLQMLCENLKNLKFSKWDYILVSDMSNLQHERTTKDSIDIFHNNICNAQSWDILSLTETYQEPKIIDLLTNNERERLIVSHPEVQHMVYQNKTKQLYDYLEQYDEYAALRKKLSRYHIYYLRMTFLDKLRDDELHNVHYMFPPIDECQFPVYHNTIESDKELVCIYLPENMEYSVVKDKLGDMNRYHVYVCGGICTDSGVVHITRRQMACLPFHRLVIVNDIMFFADQPIHAEDITLLVTTDKLENKWKGIDIPYDGRSLLYNVLDRITRLCFFDDLTKRGFMNYYELEPNKDTCFILNDTDLDVNTKYRNRIICYNSEHIDEYIAIFRRIKQAIPNIKMHIYGAKKEQRKEYKKEKDVFVDISNNVIWNGDILLEYDNPQLFREAISNGIICVGKNKDYCHVQLPDNHMENVINQFISIIQNPIKKKEISLNIKSTFDGVSYREKLFS